MPTILWITGLSVIWLIFFPWMGSTDDAQSTCMIFTGIISFVYFIYLCVKYGLDIDLSNFFDFLD